MAIGNGPVFGVKGDETSYPQIGIIKTDAEGIGSECVTSMNNIMTDATYSLNTIDMVAVPEEFNTATPDLTISDVDITTETGCVDFVGAVEEPQNNTIQMAVFPNPSGGVFRVDVSTDDALQFTHLEIYNQIGLLVFKTEDPAILNNGLDLTLQPEGIYYLNGVFGHKKAVARVVILR